MADAPGQQLRWAVAHRHVLEEDDLVRKRVPAVSHEAEVPTVGQREESDVDRTRQNARSHQPHERGDVVLHMRLAKLMGGPGLGDPAGDWAVPKCDERERHVEDRSIELAIIPAELSCVIEPEGHRLQTWVLSSHQGPQLRRAFYDQVSQVVRDSSLNQWQRLISDGLLLFGRLPL